MKTYFILIVILSIFLITGCTVKKDFTFTLEKEFVQTNSPNKSFSMVGDVSAASASSDFDKYKGDIDKVEVVSGKYLVSYFSGSAAQNISAHLKIGDVNGQQSVDLATIQNVVLLSVAAKDQNLDLSSAGVQKLVDLIRNSPNSARIYFDGSTNEAPLTATMKIKIEIKVTYKTSFI